MLSKNIEMSVLLKTALLFTSIISKYYKSALISKYGNKILFVLHITVLCLKFHFHLKSYKKGRGLNTRAICKPTLLLTTLIRNQNLILWKH